MDNIEPPKVDRKSSTTSMSKTDLNESKTEAKTEQKGIRQIFKMHLFWVISSEVATYM